MNEFILQRLEIENKQLKKALKDLIWKIQSVNPESDYVWSEIYYAKELLKELDNE